MSNINSEHQREPSLNIVVFSKDRACQLDLLLSSMQKMFHEHSSFIINVMYATSNNSFEKGYKILKNKYSKVIFCKEKEFKNDLISLINPKSLYTVFLVDDIVWKEPFSINCDELKLLNKDKDILCLSLRLDTSLDFCYAYNTKMRAPNVDELSRWNWKTEEGDFAYPMSLDGHIFRTRDIYPLLNQLTYKNPNTLELELSKHPLHRRKMICLNKAPIFNTPINKVQHQFSNRHGSISAEFLNDKFLSGYRIDADMFIGFNNNACHQEVEVTMKRLPFLEILKNKLIAY